jgi:hypothetical protein
MVAPVLIAGLAFTSSFLSGIGAYNQAKAQASSYKQQAEIYRRNAQILRQKGAMNEDIMRSQKRATMAEKTAALGEVGMSESPTTVSHLATTSSALEQNILNERFAVESEAENYLYQSQLALSNAKKAKSKGRNAFASSFVGGLSSGFNYLK